MPRLDTLHVNGVSRTIAADPEQSLLSVLREELDLTGTKYGCGEGQCGACIVLLEGEPVPACITPAGAAAGKTVLTIEGLAGEDGRLHPLQQAFVDEGAMQCGYCTPGMIMMALALLRRRPDPPEAEIVQWMQNNICRCGVYGRIVRAIRRASPAGRSAAAPGAVSSEP